MFSCGDSDILKGGHSPSQEIHSLVLVRGNIGKIMLINKLSSLQRRENCFITWYYPRPASDSQILMVMQLQPWLSFYITNYLALSGRYHQHCNTHQGQASKVSLSWMAVEIICLLFFPNNSKKISNAKYNINNRMLCRYIQPWPALMWSVI